MERTLEEDYPSLTKCFYNLKNFCPLDPRSYNLTLFVTAKWWRYLFPLFFLATNH